MKKLLFSLLFLPNILLCCDPSDNAGTHDTGRFESTDMTASTPSGSVAESSGSTSNDHYYGGFDAYEGTGFQSVDTGWNGISPDSNSYDR
jgi:hypothetical protein